MAQYIPVQRVQLVRESTLHVAKKTIKGSSSACQVFADFFADLASPQENFVVGTLDTKNNVTGISIITVGTLDASLVHPREVFRYALLQGASSIILAHNHPSGDPAPSIQDIAVTKRLVEIGKLIGIDVLDHIIVGDTAISLQELGDM